MIMPFEGGLEQTMNSAPLMRRFLVATPSAVINQDLREALESYADAHVDVFFPLPGLSPDCYELAILGMPIDQVISDPFARALRKAGTAIVVLDSRLDSSALKGTGVFVLDQPFSTEGLERLLAEIGIVASQKG